MLFAWKKANWRPQYLCSTTSPKIAKDDYLLTCNVSSDNRLASGIECLVDTGATNRNYVSRELGERILGMGTISSHATSQPYVAATLPFVYFAKA